MAFPASTVTLEEAWSSIRSIALKLRIQVQALRDASAAGATGRNSYINLQRQLDQAVQQWNTLSATPGLQAYARDQISEPTLNLSAEFVAMRDSADALRGWIFSNIPRDGASGAVLIYTVDESGNRSELTVSSNAASGFRTQADTFLATIL